MATEIARILAMSTGGGPVGWLACWASSAAAAARRGQSTFSSSSMEIAPEPSRSAAAKSCLTCSAERSMRSLRSHAANCARACADALAVRGAQARTRCCRECGAERARPKTPGHGFGPNRHGDGYRSRAVIAVGRTSAIVTSPS